MSEKIFTAAHFKAFSSANPNGLSYFEYDEINDNLIDRFVVSHKGKSFILTSNPRDTKMGFSRFFTRFNLYCGREFFTKLFS